MCERKIFGAVQGSLDQPAARNEAPREPSTSVPCVTLRCVNSDVISERERFRAVQGSLAQPAARNEAPRDSNTSSHMSTTIATPTRSSEAIERGLECFAQQDYETAIDYFTQSLELPGNGFVRSPGARSSPFPRPFVVILLVSYVFCLFPSSLLFGLF
jgi:hypothetical protein